MSDDDELRAIDASPSNTSAKVPLSATWRVRCPGNADTVLQTAKAILRSVLDPAVSMPEAAQAWFQPDPETPERLRRARMPGAILSWSTPSSPSPWDHRWWLFWMGRDFRAWVWHDATPIDAHQIRFRTTIDDLNFPWGNLHQMWLASGATDVSLEEIVARDPLVDAPGDDAPTQSDRIAVEIDRADARIAIGDTPEGLRILEAALEQWGDAPFPRLHEALGHARLYMGQLDSSLEAFETSLADEWLPEVCDAYYGRAMALAFLGRGAEIALELRRIVDANPRNRRAAQALAWVRRTEGMTAQARESYSRLVALDRRAAALDTILPSEEPPEAFAARGRLRRDIEEAGLFSSSPPTISADLPLLQGYQEAFAALHAYKTGTVGDADPIDLDWFRLGHDALGGDDPWTWTKTCVNLVRGLRPGEPSPRASWRGQRIRLQVRPSPETGLCLVGAVVDEPG